MRTLLHLPDSVAVPPCSELQLPMLDWPLGGPQFICSWDRILSAFHALPRAACLATADPTVEVTTAHVTAVLVQAQGWLTKLGGDEKQPVCILEVAGVGTGVRKVTWRAAEDNVEGFLTQHGSDSNAGTVVVDSDSESELEIDFSVAYDEIISGQDRSSIARDVLCVALGKVLGRSIAVVQQYDDLGAAVVRIYLNVTKGSGTAFSLAPCCVLGSLGPDGCYPTQPLTVLMACRSSFVETVWETVAPNSDKRALRDEIPPVLDENDSQVSLGNDQMLTFDQLFQFAVLTRAFGTGRKAPAHNTVPYWEAVYRELFQAPATRRGVTRASQAVFRRFCEDFEWNVAPAASALSAPPTSSAPRIESFDTTPVQPPSVAKVNSLPTADMALETDLSTPAARVERLEQLIELSGDLRGSNGARLLQPAQLQLAREHAQQATQQQRRRLVVLGRNGIGKSSMIDCVVQLGEVAQAQYAPAGTVLSRAMRQIFEALPADADRALSFEQFCAKGWRQKSVVWEQRIETDVPLEDITADQQFVKHFLEVQEDFASNGMSLTGCFLLPSANTNFQRTTLCPLAVTAGPMYEAVMEFHSVDAVFGKIASYWSGFDDYNISDAVLHESMVRLTNLIATGRIADDMTDCPHPVTVAEVDDMSDSRIKSYLGQSLVFSGTGGDLQLDRLYVRKSVQKYMDQKDLCMVMKRMVVYAPCVLLSEASEIVDVPGCNDSDPTTQVVLMDELRQADAVLIVLNETRSLAGQNDVLQFVRNARLVPRLQEGRLALGIVVNNDKVRQLSVGDLKPDSKKQGMIEQDRKMLQQSLVDLQTLAARSAASLAVSSACSYFRLFTSIALSLKGAAVARANPAAALPPAPAPPGPAFERTQGFQLLDMIHRLLQGPDRCDAVLLDGARQLSKSLRDCTHAPAQELSAVVRERAHHIKLANRFGKINELVKSAPRCPRPLAPHTKSFDGTGTAGWVLALQRALSLAQPRLVARVHEGMRGNTSTRLWFEKQTGGQLGTRQTLPLFEHLMPVLLEALEQAEFFAIVEEDCARAQQRLDLDLRATLAHTVQGLLFSNTSPAKGSTASSDEANVARALDDFLTRNAFQRVSERHLTSALSSRFLRRAVEEAVLQAVRDGVFQSVAQCARQELEAELQKAVGQFCTQLQAHLRSVLNSKWDSGFSKITSKFSAAKGPCLARDLVRDFIATLVQHAEPSAPGQDLRRVREGLDALIVVCSPQRENSGQLPFSVRHTLLLCWMRSDLRSDEDLRASSKPLTLPATMPPSTTATGLERYLTMDRETERWKQFSVPPWLANTADAAEFHGDIFAAVAWALGLFHSPPTGGLKTQPRLLENASRELRVVVCSQLLKLKSQDRLLLSQATVAETLEQLLTLQPHDPLAVFPHLASFFGCQFVVYQQGHEAVSVGCSPNNRACHVIVDVRKSTHFVLGPRAQSRRVTYSPQPPKMWLYDLSEEEREQKRLAAEPALAAAAAVMHSAGRAGPSYPFAFVGSPEFSQPAREAKEAFRRLREQLALAQGQSLQPLQPLSQGPPFQHLQQGQPLHPLQPLSQGPPFQHLQQGQSLQPLQPFSQGPLTQGHMLASGFPTTPFPFQSLPRPFALQSLSHASPAPPTSQQAFPASGLFSGLLRTQSVSAPFPAVSALTTAQPTAPTDLTSIWPTLHSTVVTPRPSSRPPAPPAPPAPQAAAAASLGPSQSLPPAPRVIATEDIVSLSSLISPIPARPVGSQPEESNKRSPSQMASSPKRPRDST